LDRTTVVHCPPISDSVTLQSHQKKIYKLINLHIAFDHQFAISDMKNIVAIDNKATHIKE